MANCDYFLKSTESRSVLLPHEKRYIETCLSDINKFLIETYSKKVCINNDESYEEIYDEINTYCNNFKDPLKIGLYSLNNNYREFYSESLMTIKERVNNHNIPREEDNIEEESHIQK